MKINLTKLVLDAQKYLVLHPYDLAHDITHHYRVYNWCQKIVENEKLSSDMDILTLAAWWHDAEGRTGKTTTTLEQSFKKNHIPLDFIDKVIKIINEHSYNKKQTTLEAKILFDADKLEYVTPERLSLFLQAVKDGYIDKKTFLVYKKDWQERVPKIPDMLHYDFSKKEFVKMLEDARKLLDSKI